MSDVQQVKRLRIAFPGRADQLRVAGTADDLQGSRAWPRSGFSPDLASRRGEVDDVELLGHRTSSQGG
jgi:hypothetical protein